MLNFPFWKTFLIVLACVGAVFTATPNFVARDLPLLPNNKVNLGLDLQGGSYLLLEVNFKAYLKEQLESLRSDIRSNFRGKVIDGQRILYRGGIRIERDKVVFNLSNPEQKDDVIDIIREATPNISISSNGGFIEVYFDPQYEAKMKYEVLQQSIEIVRRRVDETGTREPDIQRQGDNRILLQVPGLQDPEHLKRLLGKTAKLTFHLVDESSSSLESGVSGLPAGTFRALYDDSNPDSLGASLVLESKVMVSGDTLVTANNGFDSRNGQPAVFIRFNNIGAKKFAEATKSNVGKPFAILLDDKVISAPVINEPILGGNAQITGRFTVQEAMDLALLLRAGALPAPLDIIEERTVGPSLGSDSVEKGKKAVILAIIMVMVFMVLSYGLFGVFSDIALVLNMFIILAILSLFGATLTLPGIAGIVLTMGMAVDANVLIFERIREEVSVGKTPFAAIENGFKQAFKTIFDSNITTLIAALILFNFGSGPVKGFAVTLSVGILSSMFSAILLTRLMVVLWLKKKRPSVIPI